MDKASRQLLERDTFAFLLNKLFFFLLLRLWDSIIILAHRTVIQHSYKLRFGLEELFFKRIISADSSWNALWQTQRTLGKTNRKSLKSGKSGVGFTVWGAFFIEARLKVNAVFHSKVNTFIHKRENRFVKLCPAPTYCTYPHSTHCPPAFEQTFSFPVTWTRPRQWVCTFFSKPAITLGHQQQNNGWKVTMERQTVWFKTATVRGEREREERGEDLLRLLKGCSVRYASELWGHFVFVFPGERKAGRTALLSVHDVWKN